jgi:2-polyprenyl-3-methyl-5-hydroxy-6-metoxy-1,4-benzoquinol methylase
MTSTLLHRIINKLLIGPLKYGKKNDYDANRYWHDRFEKYGDSIKGPGNESLSEEENWKMYEEAKRVFLKTCQDEAIQFSSSRICEIGLGVGFYTQILKDKGVKNYKGYDISDVLIPRMKKKFPEFHFEQKDISSELLKETYDVILLIDVIQHIVNDDKFEFTLKNIASSLSDKGIFIIGPLEKKNTKQLYYVRSWTIKDVGRFFSQELFSISASITFRGSDLYVIRKNAVTAK